MSGLILPLPPLHQPYPMGARTSPSLTSYFQLNGRLPPEHNHHSLLRVFIASRLSIRALEMYINAIRASFSDPSVYGVGPALNSEGPGNNIVGKQRSFASLIFSVSGLLDIYTSSHALPALSPIFTRSSVLLSRMSSGYSSFAFARISSFSRPGYSLCSLWSSLKSQWRCTLRSRRASRW